MTAEIKKTEAGSGTDLTSAFIGALKTTVKIGLLTTVGLPVGFAGLHGTFAGVAAGFNDYDTHSDHLFTSVGTGVARFLDVGSTDLGIVKNLALYAADGGLPTLDKIATTALDITKHTPSQP